METAILSGALFCSMITEGTFAIAAQAEQVNQLNVFPVPDGDTGTNMSMTMGAAVRELEKLSLPTLPKAATTAASALLRGARGNSGVILSLLFRGMAKQLRETETATGRDLALAMREGVDAAYKAVMKPAEGTILTVSRIAAQHAVELCQADASLSPEAVLEAIVERAKTALADTQHQNPVLEKAGVVDAGGFGLLLILEGMLDAMRGKQRERPAALLESKPAADFTATDSSFRYTYCTEFIAQRRDSARNVNRFRHVLDSMGDSLVIVEDEDIIKVHVHTDHPGKILEEGLKFGPLVTVKIENMREQHTARVIEGTADAPAERVIAPAEKKYGFVVVASGKGMADMFRDLGVDRVVEGGQTLNPSTSEILRAVDAVPAEIVFVLPNNKNIILAAEQAARLAEPKQLIVIPTRTVPQGMSAMLAADTSCGDPKVLAAQMQEATRHVRSGMVTVAARDSEFNGKKIKKGDYLSLSENELCASGREHAVIRKLAREMVKPESTYAVLLYGRNVTPEQAETVRQQLCRENKNLEISVIDGGQPVYDYILSVE